MMRIPTRNRRRLLSCVVLALATAGISVPSAQGAAGFPVWPPDEHAGQDRATRAAQVVKPDGFDWDDAAAGAAMSLTAALLGCGAILAARRPQAQGRAGDSVATSRGVKEAQA